MIKESKAAAERFHRHAGHAWAVSMLLAHCAHLCGSDTPETPWWTHRIATTPGPCPALAHQARAKSSDLSPVCEQSGQRPMVYAGDHLQNIQIPVGGIGAGEIIFDSAARSTWHTFGNFKPQRVGAFLALRTQIGDRAPILRALQAVDERPFKGLARRTFSGELPFGWYDFRDEALPVKAYLEVYNPMIPLNLKDSAIPCAIVNLTLVNPGQERVRCDIVMVVPNPFGGQVASTRIDNMHGGPSILFGDAGEPGVAHSVAVMALSEAARATAHAGDDTASIYTALRDEADLRGKRSVSGVQPRPALMQRTLLGPEEAQRFSFVIAWHAPGVVHGIPKKGWGGTGNQYENWWEDAGVVAGYVRQHFTRLEQETRLFHDTVYDSDLPRWLIDRIVNPLSALRSRTVFWTRDGFFGGWEGSTHQGGVCGGTCNHVWHYAQGHARLWPDLGRIMRRQAFDAMRADGAIPMRLPSGHPSFDGQCGDILGAYREHLVSGDDRFLKACWPKIKRAMSYLIAEHDRDRDGVPTDGKMHHTLDADIQGGCSWLGSIYLAALAACRHMAGLQEDHEFAGQCEALWRDGSVRQNELFWNGAYYQGDSSNYAHGCAVDQVLGEWWANQLGLPRAYASDRVRSGLKSLMRHNFQADPDKLPGKWGWWAKRRYITDYQRGLVMILWPDMKVPKTSPNHHSSVLKGFEQAAAATMFQYGLLDEGTALMQAIRERYDGRLHKGVNGRFGRTSGNPFGDDECGRWYSRGLGCWSLLTSLQGFRHDGPGGMIGFAPTWRPEKHSSGFVASEGWGRYRQTIEDDRLAVEIRVMYGKCRLKQLLLGIGHSRGLRIQRVSHDEQRVPFRDAQEDRHLRLDFEREIVISAGERLVVAGEIAE